MSTHSFFPRRPLASLALALALALGGASVGAAPFTFQGFLEQGGTPVDGTANLTFRLFPTATGGTQLGPTINASAYPVLGGVFTIDLDFTGVSFADQPRFVQVEVNGNPLTPRIEVMPAPLASSARGLQGRSVSAAAPTGGQVLKWNGSAWAPGNDEGTSYSAGGGLTLSGTTFSVNFAGSGSAATAARSDHTHYGSAWSGSDNLAGLWVTNTNATTEARGIHGSYNGSALRGAGVRGQSTSPTGIGVVGAGFEGIRGVSSHSGGIGVYGWNSATTGTGFGVEGITVSETGGASGVRGTATASAGAVHGVHGRSESSAGRGVYGEATSSSGSTVGVYGLAASTSGVGVRGDGQTGMVAQGQSMGLDGAASNPVGQAIGVRGSTGSPDGAGVFAINSANSGNAFGAYAQTNSTTGTALVGDALATSGNNRGVLARTASGSGVGLRAENTATTGGGRALEAIGNSVNGDTLIVEAKGSGNAWAIRASSDGTPGRVLNALLTNPAATGVAVYAQVNNASARAIQGVNLAAGGEAARFDGNVNVTGTLSKGGGSFKIDHPLDPANRYLLHSFVESPDMMNVYNGNVVTDAGGRAVVELPDWFEALNRDFRYQLTVIGSFARAMVADEVKGNRFVIRTDAPNVKVSWQVTGIRKDPWAEQYRIPVELDKAPEHRGKYLHPEVHGAPVTKRIGSGDAAAKD